MSINISQPPFTAYVVHDNRFSHDIFDTREEFASLWEIEQRSHGNAYEDAPIPYDLDASHAILYRTEESSPIYMTTYPSAGQFFQVTENGIQQVNIGVSETISQFCERC